MVHRFKIMGNIGFLYILCLLLFMVKSQYQPYVPSYLQNRYPGIKNPGVGGTYGSVKSVKTPSKTGRYNDVVDRNDCTKYPEVPETIESLCNTKQCELSCVPPLMFADGSVVATLTCVHGKWKPSKGNWEQLSGCADYGCSPPCQNGGQCGQFWGCNCPSGYDGSHCEKPPSDQSLCTPRCLNGGVCVHGRCSCKNRYRGIRCEVGPCRPWCQNGGWCLPGNICRCPPGTSGYRCEDLICDPPCANGGSCQIGNRCQCPRGWSGNRCEVNEDCAPLSDTPNAVVVYSAKYKQYAIRCGTGYVTPSGYPQEIIECHNGRWSMRGSDPRVAPVCEPKCEPSCENDGICVSPNKCVCLGEFTGDHCQNANLPCKHHPTMPTTVRWYCTTDICYLQCLPGLTFPDGSIVTQLRCVDSEWLPSNPAWERSQGCEGAGPTTDHVVTHIPIRFSTQRIHTPRYELGTTFCNGTLCDTQPAPRGTIYPVNSQFATDLTDIRHHGGTTVPAEFQHASTQNYPNTRIHDMTTPESIPSIPKSHLPRSSAYCITWGGTHYKTLDGRIYSFEGKCSRVLLKTRVDAALSITAGGKTCSNSGKCFRNMKIYYQDKEYSLTKTDEDIILFLEDGKSLTLPTRLPNLAAKLTGESLTVSLESLGVVVWWDGNMLIQIYVPESLWDNTEGLCGTLNGNMYDDMSIRDGNGDHSLDVILNSWKASTVEDACFDEPTIADPCGPISEVFYRKAMSFCKEVLMKDSLHSCGKAMNTSEAIRACMWDYCGCKKPNRNECACGTINTYIRKCASQGIIDNVNMETEDVCQLTCPKGKVYDSCVKEQTLCGGNKLKLGEHEICLQGCYCPEGKILHEDKCVLPEDCPCQSSGISHLPGTRVAKQCNTCECKAGTWNCTQKYCPARCSIIGDPHYITFDGRRYDFMGHCSYLLVKTNNVSIVGENVPCPGSMSSSMNYPTSVSNILPTCLKSVTIKVPMFTIKLEQNRNVFVNGMEVANIPYSHGGFTIKSISSIFLAVTFPSGLKVWWDGISRAYIDAPKEFVGQTQGLCGTFNYNQLDDFSTPDNDVGQTAPSFADKWKTSEACSDTDEQPHPCERNVQNKIIAEKHCQKLKSDIFKGCHQAVDPEKYYADCLYDMCSCEFQVSDCLCPILASYGDECSRENVAVSWRGEVRECGVQCFGGQTFSACTDPCKRSCRDIATDESCEPICVEGCTCPAGYALDDAAECVPVVECECYRDGLAFEPNAKEVVRTVNGPEICTCTNASWACEPATTEEITKFSLESHKKDPCDASANMEFTNCESLQPKTCKNWRSFVDEPPLICHAGCKCKDDYVLDTQVRRCVKPEQCGCHHGSKTYPSHSEIQVDCNVCECFETKWKCTSNDCAGECSTWGDSHFKTFDGKHFDFQGQCDYILAEGELDSTERFRLITQNVVCGSFGTTCSKSLVISVNRGNDKEKLILTRGKPIGDYTALKYLTVNRKGYFVIVEAVDLGLRIRWDNGTRIYVKVDPRWKDKVRGLCGNYNNNNQDDFKTPSSGVVEASAQLFGDSWRLQHYCSNAIEISDTCKQTPDRRIWAEEKCSVLKSPAFAACHSQVSYREYLGKCVFDSCACDKGGDCECLCTAIAAYAQECANQGIDIRWRTPQLCPMQCDSLHTDYNSCASPCPVETCENLMTLSKFTKTCVADSCVEACVPTPCPDGQIYLNSTYMECVPRDVCKPICMVYNGTYVFEGDLVEEDECHRCHCSRGHMVCKGNPCKAEKLISKVSPPSVKLFTCKPGWTEWINQDKRIPAVTKSSRRKLSEIEPVPTLLIMEKLRGSKCSRNEIDDIQCRIVGTHISANDSRLELVCDLINGLVCRSTDTVECPDFELRVHCTCDEFDGRYPNEAHESDCRKYYHYSLGVDGKVEKEEMSCGEMFYDTEAMVCDWPYNVIKIRPECYFGSKVPQRGVNDGKCPPGSIYSECAIPCNQMCLYFSHIMVEAGICDVSPCVAGCVTTDSLSGCPPGMLRLNNETCVARHDCLCASHQGHPVKPGVVYEESECEICQCIDNYYTCDISKCSAAPEYVPNFNYDESSPVTHVPYIVTPPLHCGKDSYVKLIEGRDPLPDVAFSASSTLGPSYSAEKARMSPQSSGSWSPGYLNQQQYLQIDLGRLEPIYGLIIQGSPVYNEYVTSYKIMYSTNGENFVYVLNEDKYPQIFRGSMDKDTEAETNFIEPFEAKVVRVNPQTWYHVISLKVELIGCDHNTSLIQKPKERPHEKSTQIESCEDDMGYNDGRLPEEQVIVSSELTPGNKKNLKLDSSGAWQPLINSPTEYIMFDFMEPRKVTGFKIRGGPDGWASQIAVKHSQNGVDWSSVIDNTNNDKIFLGNFDPSALVMTKFDFPINATYIKIIPRKWQQNIQMKVEVIGCFEPYPYKSEPTSSAEITNTTCLLCKGVEQLPMELNACECPLPFYWNGHACVEKTQCPCVVGHMSYAIGSLFEKEDCSQCVCALGGLAHCTTKSCQCEQGLQKIVTNTCTCTCQPCPQGKVLCPTCNVCINKELWCNGIQDCSDDEINCDSNLIQPTPQSLDHHQPEAEEAVCGAGFEETIVKLNSTSFTKYLSKLSPMYKSTAGKTFSLENSGDYQSRHYKKSGLPRPDYPAENGEAEIINVCKPSRPPPKFIVNTRECPTNVCPEGFLASYYEVRLEDKQCPEYVCIQELHADSVCEVLGKSVRTFDGTLYKYDIHTHVLARNPINEAWEISLRKCCSDTCSNDLTIIHDNHKFVAYSNFSATFDGHPYTLDHVKEIGRHFKAFQISINGKSLLFVSNAHGFWVMWSEYGDIHIGILDKLAGSVDGLCGYFNHDPTDDKTRPDGRLSRSTTDFVNSWEIPGENSTDCAPVRCSDSNHDTAWQMCNKVNDISFSDCAKLLNIDMFLSHCVETTCECLSGALTRTDIDNCKCEALQSFVSTCMTADPKIKFPDWRIKLDCSATCEHPFVYQDCFQRKCEMTCDSMADPTACPVLSNLCFPGCYCPPGTVRRGDVCIKPSDCRDCECNLLPQLQYVTYDGGNVTATGTCVYTMTRDRVMNKYDEHKFQVLITNVPCQDKKGQMCLGKITILYKGKKIFILLDATKQNLMMLMDGEKIDSSSKVPDWMTVTKTPAKHLKILLLDLQIEVSVYYPSLGTSVKAPSSIYAGKLEGLCGDCNKNYKDDMMLPSGELTDDKDEFTVNWLYENLPGGQTVEQCENLPHKECKDIPIDEDPCVQLVDINIFGQCHPVLDPLLFIDWCKRDTCSGNVKLACTSIQSYARECGRLGFCIKWRTDLCPAKECPPNLTYDPCGPNCPRTCDTVRGVVEECKNVTVEGCFCPDEKVFVNDTCVSRNECITCDAEGHHPGEVWRKDKCTACHCEGGVAACNTTECSESNSICGKGYTSVTIPAGEEECCNKFSCVPEPTATQVCNPPTEIECEPGQVSKLEKKPNGCEVYICACRPPHECEPPLPIAREALEDGYRAVFDTSGCCPSYKLVCEPELCSSPPNCPPYHSLSNRTVHGKCCPVYGCDPPRDKCIIEAKYTEKSGGGERLRNDLEVQVLLKNPGDVWNDGPCRECKCIFSSNNVHQSICQSKTCPMANSHPDSSRYVLKEDRVPGECCPKLTRTACRHGNQIYEVGDPWVVDDDYCAIFQCIQTTTGEIRKATEVISCDTDCGPGYEYVPPDKKAKECCGSCRAVSCVTDGKVYKPGDRWFSADNCIQFVCADLRGSLQIRAMLFSCPKLSDDLLDNFVFNTTMEAGKCCEKHQAIACKENDEVYEVGKTWLTNEGDKCKQTTCFRKPNGELGKRESIETCMTSCAMGWQYKPSNDSCCGKCVPAGCITDDGMKEPNDVWTSEDGCSAASCKLMNNQYVVMFEEEACPSLPDCPKENIVQSGCCKYCNTSFITPSLCVAEVMPFEKTIGILQVNHESHGICSNKEPILYFSECKGTCQSGTEFNKDRVTYSSQCACCRPTNYKAIHVELICPDGYKFTQKVMSPTICNCESCDANLWKKSG